MTDFVKGAYCIGDIEDHAMLKDVLKLLKEQEAVEPKQIGQGWFCGSCDALLSIGNEKIVKFCSMCGKPIKWDCEMDARACNSCFEAQETQKK